MEHFGGLKTIGRIFRGDLLQITPMIEFYKIEKQNDSECKNIINNSFFRTIALLLSEHYLYPISKH